MKKSMILVAVVTLVLVSGGPSLSAGLNDYKFLKIAPLDQRAVVKTADGTLQLVKVGDMLAEEARIIEIAEGRILLQRHDSQGDETVIVRLQGKTQRLERIRKRNLTPPVAPVVVGSSRVSGE